MIYVSDTEGHRPEAVPDLYNTWHIPHIPEDNVLLLAELREETPRDQSTPIGKQFIAISDIGNVCVTIPGNVGRVIVDFLSSHETVIGRRTSTSACTAIVV